jgi:Ca2+/Na+ antiporter
MSGTYYRVLKILEDVTNEKIKWTKEKKFILILFILSCLLFFTSLILQVFLKKTEVSFILIIGAVIFMFWFIKKAKSINPDYIRFERKINDFYEKLLDFGINTESKINELQLEIEKETEKNQEEIKRLYSGLGKIFIYSFWIPGGFLIGYYFKNHPEEFNDYNLILSICIKLLSIMVILFSTFIVLLPEFYSFFDFEKNKRKKVFTYLQDVKYFYYMKDEQL